ncbi:hypothetical protein LO80_03190 [Candidatus Francisella endociliophora]|uniref:Major tail protein n=1 Tax=Candidatus Francisella endociliophora TaxID=653937 RepID=A0A097END7_9GAMM|nr:phage tail tube protein [Francisella sp. FSC1006]AIT09074.1 hypothetical protein LO80_03190 [Francisella sp. FSC1006]
MATNSNKSIGLVRESVMGVTPNNPEFTTVSLDKTGSTFTAEPESINSRNKAKGRDPRGAKVVGLSSSGTIDADLEYGHLETVVIESAMLNDWVSQGRTKISADADQSTIQVADETSFSVDDIVASHGSVAVVTTVNANELVLDAVLDNASVGDNVVKVGKRITDVDIVGSTIVSTGSFDFTTLNLKNGQFIKLDGFSADNNVWVRVVSITATVITVDLVPDTWTDESIVGEIDLYHGEYIVNGTTLVPFSTCITYGDLSTESYRYYSGNIVNTMEFSVTNKQAMTINCALLGLYVGNTETKKTGQTDLDPYASNLIDGSNNIARFVLNGNDLSSTNIVTAMSLSLNNTAAQTWGLGSKYPQKVNAGDLEITGNITAFLESIDQFDNAVNNSDLDLVSVQEINGQAMVLNVPVMNLTGITEQDQDDNIIVEQPYSAKYSDQFGYTFMLQKFEGVA